jgi:Na+-driven multidrug efflux pump
VLGLPGKYVKDILRLGTGSTINHLVMTLVNVVLNNVLKTYGALSAYGSDIPLAVSGIAAKINSILISFGVGLSHGCQPIIGFNYGARNYSRVKKTYKMALMASLAIGLVAFLAFQLFPHQITSVFGSGDVLYYDFAAKYLRIYLMMTLVFGMQPMSMCFFTAIGNVRHSILISLSRQGFFLIPLLLVLPLFFGLSGVLWAGPISDALACAFALMLVVRDFRRLDALKMQTE